MGARRLWSQRPSRVAEGKIKTNKRDPRRREKAPARCSSTGDAHTPPGHASPAARSMPDGRRPPRPLESAAAGACSSVARVQANAFPHSAPCTSTTALHSSARHTRRVEAEVPPAVNQSQPLGHAAPARPVPQRLRHDHLLSQATVSGARALAWPCSVPPPRTWLTCAAACAPATKQGGGTTVHRTRRPSYTSRRRRRVARGPPLTA